MSHSKLTKPVTHSPSLFSFSAAQCDEIKQFKAHAFRLEMACPAAQYPCALQGIVQMNSFTTQFGMLDALLEMSFSKANFSSLGAFTIKCSALFFCFCFLRSSLTHYLTIKCSR